MEVLGGHILPAPPCHFRNASLAW